MPADVVETLREIFMEKAGLTKDQAEQYFKDLVRTKRFQRETWS